VLRSVVFVTRKLGLGEKEKDSDEDRVEIESELEPDEESDNIDFSTPDDDVNCEKEKLAAYFPLDGNWNDVCDNFEMRPYKEGGFVSSPLIRSGESRCYSALGDSDNGATTEEWIQFDTSEGISIEGWVKFSDDNQSEGMIFGFDLKAPSASRKGIGFYDYNSYIVLEVGKNDSAHKKTVRIRRLSHCWHHLAVVVPAEPDQSVIIYFDGNLVYVDGVVREPYIHSNDPIEINAEYVKEINAPFVIGNIINTKSTENASLVDEVKLWKKPLSQEEIKILATPSGDLESGECFGGISSL